MRALGAGDPYQQATWSGWSLLSPPGSLWGISSGPTGTWLLDQPPLMPAQRYPTHEEWEARIAQARATFGKD